MNIGDKIQDCYMGGIGELQDIGCNGVIESIGIDWVIIRNQERNKPIFVDKTITELEEFLEI